VFEILNFIGINNNNNNTSCYPLGWMSATNHHSSDIWTAGIETYSDWVWSLWNDPEHLAQRQSPIQIADWGYNQPRDVYLVPRAICVSRLYWWQFAAKDYNIKNNYVCQRPGSDYNPENYTRNVYGLISVG